MKTRTRLRNTLACIYCSNKCLTDGYCVKFPVVEIEGDLSETMPFLKSLTRGGLICGGK